MSFIFINAEWLVMLSAATSTFAATLLVLWPYLARDQLNKRMGQVSSEREKIRVRERARLASQNRQTSLRTEPKKLFKTIVDRFDLAKQTEDGELVQMLRMAGFRGPGPVV